MESIEPLIHKLLQQAQGDATPAQLLITVELIRNELIDSRPAATTGYSAVSVWLPSGFKAATSPTDISQNVAGIAKAPQPPTQIVHQVPDLSVPSVLVTPMAVVPNPMAPAFEESAIAHASTVSPDEAPIVYELHIEPEPIKREPAKSMPIQLRQQALFGEPHQQYLPDFIKNSGRSGGAMQPANRSAGELNQTIGAETAVLNETFAGKPVLADRLAAHGGVKVGDLRKALSINEKYQFINHLFRGDEAMFERSLRTLNNFAILPEARYWMQRELVVKLGWTEMDELVQQFYQLVSRRFS
jgi:hypothetical protein